MTVQSPNVILRGGPAVKVKLLKGNRYEHFEPTDGTVLEDELELLVYDWSGDTYVAE